MIHLGHVPQLWLLCSDEAPRLLSFVKMYAIATLAPRLEWPRDRQTTPPRRSKPLASNFFDGLLDIFLSLASPVSPRKAGALVVAEEAMLFMVSNPGGACVKENVSYKHKQNNRYIEISWNSWN